MPELMCLKCGRWISYKINCPNCGESLDMAKNFIILSKAYLEASELLCSQMSDGSLPQEYSRSLVVLSLALHSVELFLKGAILKKLPEIKIGEFYHDINKLKREYDNLYSEEKYQLEVPFYIKYLGGKESSEKFPLDQVHRYPTNKEGKEWKDVEIYLNPDTFLKELKRFKSEFDRLEKEIFTE
jgi:hypothetical protein